MLETIEKTQNYNALLLNSTDDEKNYYLNNIWDIRQHPQFENLNEKQKSSIFNSQHYFVKFSTVGNHYINIELKQYCIYLLESRQYKLTTFIQYSYCIQLISTFFSEEYSEIKSVIMIPLKELENRFEQFLKLKGQVTAVSFATTTNASMGKTKYFMRSIPIRFLRGYYNYNSKLINKDENLEEYEKISWDIRYLDFEINGFDPSRPRYIIDFSKISQEKIQSVAKWYTKIRLKNGKKFSTCQHDIKGINYLSSYLEKYYPKVRCLSELNRKIMEGFLGYIELSCLAERTKSSRIGCVITFFNYCELFNHPDRPRECILFPNDSYHKNKLLPRPIPRIVENQLIEAVGKMPPQIARMVIVIHAVGMRIGELCRLQTNSIHLLPSGSYYIEYLQEKTQKLQSVVLENEIAYVVLSAIKYSQFLYGENVKYVFCQNERKPISQDKFVRELNKLSYESEIRDSKGNLYRFKPHQFRHTVASNYINMGIDPKILQYLMGWRNLTPYLNYVELNNQVLKEAINPLLDDLNNMIKNRGKSETPLSISESTEAFVPLSNGWCTKPIIFGKCELNYGINCYLCAAFIATLEDLPTYQFHFNQAALRKQIGIIDNNEQVIEINSRIIASLEQILLKFAKK